MKRQGMTRVVVFYREARGMQRYEEFEPNKVVVLVEDEARQIVDYVTWAGGYAPEHDEYERAILDILQPYSAGS